MLFDPPTEKIRIIWLHGLVWLSVIIISFFSMLPVDGAGKSALSAAVSGCFYAVIVYGNIFVLYPHFYHKKKYVLYALALVALLVVAGFGRGYLSLYIRDASFAAAPHILDLKSHITFLLSVTTVFVLSFIFRLAMAYFTLRQQSEKILLQQSQFELKLLKAQVQPHFLFNTLNNIYYEAFVEAPRTALLIEKLSEIMRYFTDLSTKELVPLATEIQFLDNYIALEKVRIKPEPEIIFHRSFDDKQQIPPMLLMTFVENVFKHGIDKISGKNEIWISLREEDNHLAFQTKNLLNKHRSRSREHGLGLKNLHQRLTILYGNAFDMHTAEDSEYFTASLKIPVR
jgi:hypothetical protein